MNYEEIRRRLAIVRQATLLLKEHPSYGFRYVFEHPKTPAFREAFDRAYTDLLVDVELLIAGAEGAAASFSKEVRVAEAAVAALDGHDAEGELEAAVAELKARGRR